MLNLRRDNHGRRPLASLDAYRAAESQARPGGRGGGGSSAGNGVLSSAEKQNANGGGNGSGNGSQNNGASPAQANNNDTSNSSTPTVRRPQLPPPSLLEYEALALRVAPPEISVDNVSRAAATVITIDSANRPGTLVSVVEFLTDRGLDVRRARISSDGGWFYDVFEVTEAGGGKVTDERKLDDIRRMLDVEYQDDADVVLNCDETDDPRRVETTVLQLAGSDRVGLLADVTQLLTASGCDVRSAAVWTYHARVACVLSVTEKGRPLASDEEGGEGSNDGAPMSSDGGSSGGNGGGGGGAKLARLRELLGEMVGAPQGLGICSIERAVRGDVRHDRRLHRLMLEEEAAAWARGEPLGRDEGDEDGGAKDGGGGVRGGPAAPEAAGRKGGEFDDSSPTPRAKSPTDSASSMEAPGTASGSSGSGNGAARGASAPPVAPPTPSLSSASPSSPLPRMLSSSSSSRSPVQTPKRPLVRVDPDPRTGYWVVTIRCTDRPKLLFDTLCTLADLDYDVYHASIDSTDKVKEGAAAAGSGSSLSSRPPSASANGASAQCHPGGGGGGGSSSSRPCGLASQEYYIRPRDGNADWDAGRAEQLVAMLEASIQRRFPRGLKVHVRSADRFGCLAALAGVLRGAALAVTRAKVRTYAATGGGHNRNNSSRNHVAGPSAGHTLYVMAAGGGPPDRAAVEAACAAVGGKLVEPGDEAASVAASGGEHAFSYSFLSKTRGSGRRGGGSATWRPGGEGGGGGDAAGGGARPSAAAAAVVAAAAATDVFAGGNAKSAAAAAAAAAADPFSDARNAMLSGLSPGTDLSDGSF